MNEKQRNRSLVAPRIFTSAGAGGIGGTEFDDAPGTILQVAVTYGSYVNSIETFWSDGRNVKHGSSAGDGPISRIFVVPPNNLLVSIDGYISSDDDDGPFVAQIRFTALDPNTGVFTQSDYWGGMAPGYAHFIFEAPFYSFTEPASGQVFTNHFAIAGFSGRAGHYLDAIGVEFQQSVTVGLLLRSEPA